MWSRRLSSATLGLLLLSLALTVSTVRGTSFPIDVGTGLDSSDAVLTADGAFDAHWTVVPQGGGPAQPAQVVQPGDADSGFGAWIANGPSSAWIARDAFVVNNGPAPYSFTRTFQLDSGVDLSNVALSGGFTMDDAGQLSLNGIVLGTSGFQDWGSFTTFSVPAGSGLFKRGKNTLTLTITTSDEDIEGVNMYGTVTGRHTGGSSGDPILTGFHGQRFLVTGAAGSVFNLVTAPSLQVNCRFISLAEGESMRAGQQKQLRLMRSLQLASASAPASGSASPLPATTAWSHAGTYQGELGVTLADGCRLYGRAGAYAEGWAELSLDGQELQVSASPVYRANGSLSVHRLTAHTLTLSTPLLQLRFVNSDHFFNVDGAQLRPGYAQDSSLDGLLGQTADPDVQPDKSQAWRQHVEQDYRVKDNDLFGSQFSRSLMHIAAKHDHAQ